MLCESPFAQIERAVGHVTAGLRDVDPYDPSDPLDDVRLLEPTIQGVFTLFGDDSVRLVSYRAPLRDVGSLRMVESSKSA